MGRKLRRGPLGNALRTERLRRDITQREAAVELGIATATYCKWERGKLVPHKGLHLSRLAWWWAQGRKGRCPLCRGAHTSQKPQVRSTDE